MRPASMMRRLRWATVRPSGVFAPAKSQMVGDPTGLLKILFSPETLKVLGVHAIGESATEIISIGQCVMALDGTIEYFRDSVFNYPTFAEAYKVAALNGLNKV